MSFYSPISIDLTDKLNLEKIVAKAKGDKIQEAVKKMSGDNDIDKAFVKLSMPDDTPQLIIETRGKNKLKAMCTQKRLKKLLG